MQFFNYVCGNQVLQFQSIASNCIIHLGVGEVAFLKTNYITF